MFQVFSRCIGQKRPHQSAGKIFQIQSWLGIFLLYPVCLGLFFYSCFYAKISPSMPDLSAWYEECASGLMLSTRCFIWNIGSALEECLLKAFLSERSIASNISTFNTSNWDEIVRAFHFANLTNIHTIQLFKVNSISTLMISHFFQELDWEMLKNWLPSNKVFQIKTYKKRNRSVWYVTYHMVHYMAHLMELYRYNMVHIIWKI